MRVLLVKDDPNTAKSIEMMLTHANLNVYCTDMGCLLYTSPSPRDRTRSRMPSSA